MELCRSLLREEGDVVEQKRVPAKAAGAPVRRAIGGRSAGSGSASSAPVPEDEPDSAENPELKELLAKERRAAERVTAATALKVQSSLPCSRCAPSLAVFLVAGCAH